MNKLSDTPKRIDEAFLSSLIEKKDDKLVYRKKGYGRIETDKPLSSIRLELALDYSGLSQSEVAERTNVPQGSISRLVTGKTKYSNHIGAISQLLNLDEQWLSGNEIEKVTHNADKQRLIVGENVYFTVKNHIQAIKDEVVINSFAVSNKTDPKNLRYISAPDQAMSPDIRMNSSAIYDLSLNDIVNGELYAIQKGNQIQLRQLFLEYDDTIRVKPRNNDFYEYTANISETDFCILGRIVCVINRLF